MGFPLLTKVLCNVAEDLADDTLSLRCLSQTCQLALNPCRQVLYRHIKLVDGVKVAVGVEPPCDRLHAIIEANPHIATFVHSLHIWNRGFGANCVPWTKTLTTVLHRIANAGHLRILSIDSMPNNNTWDTCGDELQAAFISLMRQSLLLQTVRFNYFCGAETGIKLLSAAATSPIVDVGLVYLDPNGFYDYEEDAFTDDEELKNEMDDNPLVSAGSQSSTDSHNGNDDLIASERLRHLKTLKIGSSSEPLVDWILSSSSEMSITKLQTLIMDGSEPDCRDSAERIVPICTNTIERLAWIEPLAEDLEFTPTHGINLQQFHRVREMTVYFTTGFLDHLLVTLEGSDIPPNLGQLNFVVELDPDRGTSKPYIPRWYSFDIKLFSLVKPLRSFESLRITFVVPPGYLEDDIGIAAQSNFPQLHSTGKLVVEVVEIMQQHVELCNSQVKASISFAGAWNNDKYYTRRLTQ